MLRTTNTYPTLLNGILLLPVTTRIYQKERFDESLLILKLICFNEAKKWKDILLPKCGREVAYKTELERRMQLIYTRSDGIGHGWVKKK